MIEIKPEWITEYFLEGLSIKEYQGKSVLTSVGDIHVQGYVTPKHLADFLNEKMKEET